MDPLLSKKSKSKSSTCIILCKNTIQKFLNTQGNAFGTQPYASGEGKGFPNATPQGGIGSRNVFARRAIAKKAATAPNHGKSCDCTLTEPKNLRN